MGRPLAHFYKHSDDCKKRFAHLCAGRPWPPPVPENSASAALASLLSRDTSDASVLSGSAATWLSESAAANPILISAEEKSKAFGVYLDDLIRVMSEFKEGIDKEAAQDAIKDLPGRIKTALAAPSHCANSRNCRGKEPERVI